MSDISLRNVTVKITHLTVDNMNQTMNFNIQSVEHPSFQTTVFGSATLAECINLSQSEIVDLIWSRASTQGANWLAYMNRTDLDLSSLNGTVYKPSNLFISGSSNAVP